MTYNVFGGTLNPTLLYYFCDRLLFTIDLPSALSSCSYLWLLLSEVTTSGSIEACILIL